MTAIVTASEAFVRVVKPVRILGKLAHRDFLLARTEQRETLGGNSLQLLRFLVRDRRECLGGLDAHVQLREERTRDPGHQVRLR